MRTIPSLGALGLALLLAACGSDDDGAAAVPPQAANEVPQSALVSAEAFSRFVGSLPPSDTSEALMLKDLLPPVSDAAEPTPIG
jgi:hypothetical protein